jgi:hypothetical protein
MADVGQIDILPTLAEEHGFYPIPVEITQCHTWLMFIRFYELENKTSPVNMEICLPGRSAIRVEFDIKVNQFVCSMLTEDGGLMRVCHAWPSLLVAKVAAVLGVSPDLQLDACKDYFYVCGETLGDSESYYVNSVITAALKKKYGASSVWTNLGMSECWTVNIDQGRPLPSNLPDVRFAHEVENDYTKTELVSGGCTCCIV